MNMGTFKQSATLLAALVAINLVACDDCPDTSSMKSAEIENREASEISPVKGISIADTLGKVLKFPAPSSGGHIVLDNINDYFDKPLILEVTFLDSAMIRDTIVLTTGNVNAITIGRGSCSEPATAADLNNKHKIEFCSFRPACL